MTIYWSVGRKIENHGSPRREHVDDQRPQDIPDPLHTSTQVKASSREMTDLGPCIQVSLHQLDPHA